jgi:hypothetical protein
VIEVHDRCCNTFALDVTERLNLMEIPRQFAIIYSTKGVMLMHILMSLLILMLPAECWSKDHPSTYANE